MRWACGQLLVTLLSLSVISRAGDSRAMVDIVGPAETVHHYGNQRFAPIGHDRDPQISVPADQAVPGYDIIDRMRFC